MLKNRKNENVETSVTAEHFWIPRLSDFCALSRLFAATNSQPFPSLIALAKSEVEMLEASDLVEWAATVQSGWKIESSLVIPNEEEGQLMSLPLTIRFLFLCAFFALGAFAPSSERLLSPSALTMGGDYEVLRILSMGVLLTCWIPGYLAFKLSRVFKREHLAGCALLSVFLGWEMQFRLTAYLFLSFC